MSFNQEQHDEVIRRRGQIAFDYCELKGWSVNPSALSWEQIMEVRSLQEWKDVPKNVLEEIK
jgi:hypothetical protein